MKIKNNKNNQVRKPLKDLYKIGDLIKYTGTLFDGRGYETFEATYTVTKVNKVTLDAVNHNNNTTFRLDRNDLMTVKKIVQEEILA